MRVTLLDNDVMSNKNNHESIESNEKIRPLHQNWWPVTLINALNKNLPNPIMALGMRLVIFHDGTSWTCLDDQCAHRFAPLSEGRVVPANDSTDDPSCKKHIQCAYHGWEFDGCGTCQCIPQALPSRGSEVRSRSKVTKYPVQAECGVLWVWTDPVTSETIAPTIDLPLSPLLKEYHSNFGDESGFMREMPYGLEFLGENLADVSHLPFSHHSIGTLRRDLGGPLPFRMMSEFDKRQASKLEHGTLSADQFPENLSLPRYQVELQEAGRFDPMIKSQNPSKTNGTLQIAFYEPSHFRHRRSGLRLGEFSVEIFLCPIESGRSRVIVWKAYRAAVSNNGNVKQDSGWWRSFRSINSWRKSFQQSRLKKRLHPASVRSHMTSHVIFDGDSVFLHKQGERMRRYGKTFRDYDQPLAADILVTAFHRYLDVAAKKSLESGHELAAASVSGKNYFDDEPRSVLLDRYESHTKHCSICQKGLQNCRQREVLWKLAGTALVGAAGASSTTLLTAVVTNVLLGPTAAVPWRLCQVLGASSLLTSAGSVVANRKKRAARDEVEKFLFVDYVHAEKP